jgi:hypothetical protein
MRNSAFQRVEIYNLDLCISNEEGLQAFTVLKAAWSAHLFLTFADYVVD